ncbi:MAG: SDR family NAD(P)-dependent oxidoreductase [Pseudomonadales bacterium]
MPRPTALITGASSGIGSELARVFAKNGYNLIVAARREDRLAGLAGELGGTVSVHPVVVDLARTKGPQRLIDAVTALGVDVDVLVNNAGVISTLPMLDADRGELANLINLNVRALTELTHHYGRKMAARGYGRILNVASVAAFQPVPGMGVYAASKAFVLSLTESLSEELRGTGVTVSALCPGPTRTEMAAALEDAGLASWFLANAASVAQEGFDACRAGQVIRVPGIANQALVSWSQYQPRWLVRVLGGMAARGADFLKPTR